MDRKSIPAIRLADGDQLRLREKGIVSVSFNELMDNDPIRRMPHYHDYFQVSIMKGRGQLMHDFREIEITGTTVFFLSPGQVHTAKPEAGMSGSIVSFTREFFESSPDAEISGLYQLPFFHGSTGLPWLSLDSHQSEVAHRIFHEIQSEFDQAEPGAESLIRSLLNILFIKCSRWHAEIHPNPANGRAARLVARFHQTVEMHFAEWHQLSPYAKALGVTENHLNYVIRDELGESAGSLIRKRRQLDAKRMLLHSDLSISEICYRLGFKDPSYFARFFRRYEKLTPAAFRDRIREKYQKIPE
ncbi:helix-turn-helix domain-containing protein [Luteolibacter pohnpeiensis]|uniref:Helix-turn-helix domain-containing protein n=1 Tax=Luteolibacter pohnpeiensis TaxID=454153 RepID=A0A934S993_9BACT|nr:helix-turn-helix domain-containing protein [Luteolibacter pohnpeiensis]MBK1881709.1 helix-turn-helix domain-containing protein [Luteolibacter pohnpeiensis]